MHIKTLAALALASMGLMACTHTGTVDKQAASAVGVEKDAHGCQLSAGYAWSVLHERCVDPVKEAQIRVDDPANATLGVYLLLSKDEQRAEVFGVNFPQATVWAATEGGYASEDGQWRVQRDAQGLWHMQQRQP